MEPTASQTDNEFSKFWFTLFSENSEIASEYSSANFMKNQKTAKSISTRPETHERSLGKNQSTASRFGQRSPFTDVSSTSRSRQHSESLFSARHSNQSTGSNFPRDAFGQFSEFSPLLSHRQRAGPGSSSEHSRQFSHRASKATSSQDKSHRSSQQFEKPSSAPTDRESYSFKVQRLANKFGSR